MAVIYLNRIVMLLPFAFVFIAAFIIIAIILIIRRSKGKKDLNEEVVSKEQAGDTSDGENRS